VRRNDEPIAIVDGEVNEIVTGGDDMDYDVDGVVNDRVHHGILHGNRHEGHHEIHLDEEGIVFAGYGCDYDFVIDY